MLTKKQCKCKTFGEVALPTVKTDTVKTEVGLKFVTHWSRKERFNHWATTNDSEYM